MKKFTKKTVAAMLSLAMSAGLFAMNASAATFTDMNPDHWAYDTVNLMVQEGVITGYDDGTFRPDDPVTLQEFAALALRAVNWPINRSEPKNVAFEFENSEYFADDAAKIRACLNACNEWAKPYVAGLISDVSPYDPHDIESRYPAMWFEFGEYNDEFEQPTEPVPRWIAFDILAEAAYYNGSELGNNIAYDAPFETTETNYMDVWGTDIEIMAWNDAPYLKTSNIPAGQQACYKASTHGLVALERTADIKRPGQTIASANPFGTLTRAEAATLNARLKHPDRRIYNAEINPANTAYYTNILNSMGFQPTIVTDTPMAESDYTIPQKGPLPEVYEEIFQAWQHAENWIQLLIEKSMQ